ncbi:MAG TPA: FIST N-terminal domain-containing protein [Gemmatimonas sp.]|uniref:FIST signal transduction protein n=1 Tax=Gemmatimonas sp. TaxID=1962908 RepID=UPI002ED837B4
MRARTVRWSQRSGWSDQTTPVPAFTPESGVHLLLAFGPIAAPSSAWFADAARRWPDAPLVYVSAGGQIDDGAVLEDEVVVTALQFDSVQVRVVVKSGAGIIPCEELGTALATDLASDPALRHALVFVDGLHVNGAALTRGINRGLPPEVTLSGGLASDGTNFVTTGVGVNGPPIPGQAVAIGFSGDALVVGTGSAGGWIPFGPERLVTRAEGPVVYELDEEPALATYKRYLGGLAAELPGSALLFPLSLGDSDLGGSVVRTILGIDEQAGSLRFAGDVPPGSKVRLMRSTNDQLLDGASNAAASALAAMDGVSPQLLLCISCIGRRAVLKSRVEEEVEEVLQLAPMSIVSGYYSNGEIAPGLPHRPAQLHNQTMTITAMGER